MAAEEYGVRLKVSADTEEARRELDSLLEEKSRRVKEAAAAASGASGSGGGSARTVEITADTVRIDGGPESAGARVPRDRQSQRADSDPGGISGRAVAKALAGFALHQGMQSAFAWARTPGADNTNVDRAQGAISGAVQFGTMGAMVGGPWGAAVGALVGGVSGLVQKLGEERQRREQAYQGMNDAARGANEGLLGQLGAEAQRRLLAGMGGEERSAWLTSQRNDLQRKMDEARARFAAVAGGDPESEEYRYRQAEWHRLVGAYGQSLLAENVDRLGDAATPWRSGDFADSFQRRGMTVGPQVDLSAANSGIVEQQTRMVDLLQKLVDLANAGAGRGGENLDAALAIVSGL